MDLSDAIRVVDQKLFELRFMKQQLEKLQLENGDGGLPVAIPQAPHVAPEEKLPAHKKRLLKRVEKKAAAPPKAPRQAVGGHGHSNKLAILEYVTAHPGCRAEDVAKGLQLPRSNVSYNLRLLNKEKQIEMLGRGRKATWQARGTKPPKSSPPAAPVGEDKSDSRQSTAKPHVCGLCAKRFILKGSLESHMRVQHHAGNV